MATIPQSLQLETLRERLKQLNAQYGESEIFQVWLNAQLKTILEKGV